MTFQERYKLNLQDTSLSRLLQLSTIICIVVSCTFANTSESILQEYKQPLNQIDNKKNLSTLSNLQFSEIRNTTSATINKRNTVSTTTTTIQSNLDIDNEESTFRPETILFQFSERKFFDAMKKKINDTNDNNNNNIKYISRKKMLNNTMYNVKPVEPRILNLNELPVEKNHVKLPTHELKKNLTSINFETRMLFDHDESN